MRIAINGFGRIGRAVFRIALEKGYNVVAINDLTDIENLVYLLKHDSVYGKYGKKVSHGENFIKVGNKKVVVCSEKDPLFLPWKKLKVDVAIEATGFFRDRDGAGKHLKAGAKRVVISAPGKDVDKMIVLGINEKNLKKNDKIIKSITSSGINHFSGFRSHISGNSSSD